MSLLQEMIKNASQQYYSTGRSNLSDEEFDALLAQEKAINPNSELLNVGHGYDVSEDNTYGEKASHRYGIVGSLPKCKTFKEFAATFKTADSDEVIESTKLDGLSIVLYFESGKFVQAITRGDGYEGIDVTPKIKQITKIDTIKDSDFTGSIRGETIMSNSNFVQFHQLHPESKNARNSVAGLINMKEITSDLDFVDVVFYTITGSENRQFQTYEEILNYLADNLVDQKITKWRKISLSSIQSDEDLNQIMKGLKDDWYGDYPYDGIVNASNQIIQSENEIRYISSAFKFKAESKETEVTGIEWNLSKTGYLVPRINFKPIQLSGATVQYCAGHNAQNISDLKIGVGAKIRVTRSNEVIPYLEEVLELGDAYELPRVCPSCGTPLIMNGVHLQCPNRECKNADIQDILLWMTNLAPVDGLGDTLKLKYLLELLGEDNLTVEGIYAHGPIQRTQSKYVKQTLFNETFNRMFTDTVRLDAAILALNIPRFGGVTASKLAKYPEEIQKAYLDPTTSPLQKLQYLQVIQSIGNANYQSLVQNEWKMKRLEFIKDRIQWNPNAGTEYKGEVCITGKLSVKRAIFEEELRKAGYVAIGSVKKDTKYLITDDPNSGSSKNKAADKHGIPKVTEKEFRSRYMQGGI